MFKQKQETPDNTDNGEFRSRAETDTKPARGGKRAERARKNQPNDPALPEKKRARRRLIGAVALVLAAVIGLPMVLDSEPKPIIDDIAIQIPSKDKPLTDGALPVPPRTSKDLPAEPVEDIVEPSSSANPSEKPSVVAEAKPEIKAEPKVEPKVEPKPDAKVAQTATKLVVVESKPAAESKPAQGKESSKESNKDATKKDASSTKKTADETARALAILEAKPQNKASASEKAADKPAGNIVVQVAAFATQEKVNEVQAKLKGAGISSFTQKVATSSGDKTRIRVGPFANKAEAQKTIAKLVKLGFKTAAVVPN